MYDNADKSKFEFYEIVTICSGPKEIVGLIGTVTGMARNDNGVWGYTVVFEGVDACYALESHHLKSTGKFNKRENFYTGDVVRVSREGKILNKDELPWLNNDDDE